MTYYNNHNHTDMSNALLGFPDVVCKVDELIQRAYDLGLSGLTITEHEGCGSHIQALKCYDSMPKDRPFILGLGNEIYLMDEDDDLANRDGADNPYYHFVLTALDTEGHKQLRELSTRAWLRAYKKNIWRRPTYYSDLEEIIGENQGHIIASTACLGSRIDRLLLDGDTTNARNEAQRLIDIFGNNNLYLEIQPAKAEDTDQSIVNRRMWKLAQTMRTLPIIPSTDSHYLSKDTTFVHKVYLNSQDGDREVDDFYATAYMMGADELRDYLRIDFTDAQINQMFEWSEEIGKRIKGYDIRHDPIIPEIPEDKLPDSYTVHHYFKEYYGRYHAFEYYALKDDNEHEEYFFYQIEQGLKLKVADKGKNIEQYIARLDEEWTELKIISEQLDTLMPNYYSTMSAIIELIWEADSLVMPARGSAAGFLTCYLLDVTQIDPVPLGDYFPSWRHLNHERGVELADIDCDSEASKKKAIVNKMKEFFGSDKVLNVATFSRISSKTALERACKGLGVSGDVAGYLKSLVPVNRGKTATLSQCFYGDKDKGIKPVYELINEIKKYDHLKECALGMEGLITNRGTHAAGVIVCNDPYTNYTAAMRSADGTLDTGYDLWDAEEAGCIKFDMLTVVAADKIHKTMDLLLKYGKIEWQGSLKATYYKYLHPDVLNYDDPNMWDILPTIYSVFQFDTPISAKTLNATKPHSVMDLSAANSLLRLMPDNADETPIERYERYVKDPQAWWNDTAEYGLTKDEQECIWQYVKDAHGLADSQEKIMRLSMDKHISGYSLKEANKLRKSIAKKDDKLQAEAKAQFFEYGEKCGTRPVVLDYVWNVLFAASMGYSFSQLHSYSYSIIALQELNLNYFYPRVYWNTACLSVEASGTDEDDSGGTDYGEMAKAIYKMKQYGVDVKPPSINESTPEFTPKEDDSSILFGLGGISSINNDIAQQIIANRPYTSFHDFYTKNAYTGSLITESKFVILVKSGCFDQFAPRIKTMKQYILYSHTPKSALTLANLQEAQRIGCKFPKAIIAPINFKRYVCSKEFLWGNHPSLKSKKIYRLDDRALRYFNANCKNSLSEGVDWWEEDSYTLVVDKSLEKLLKSSTESLKEYMNTPEFIDEFNRLSMRKRYEELVPNQNVNRWSLESTSFYHNGHHELENLDFARYNIDRFRDLPEEPQFVEKSWGSRTWKQYELSAICGTLLSKSDNNHLITLLTPENDVVSIKLYAGLYAHFKAQISETNASGKKTVIEKPWLSRGNLLIVTGYRRGESDYVCRNYKNSIYASSIMKIENVYEDGSAEIVSKRYGDEEE